MPLNRVKKEILAWVGELDFQTHSQLGDTVKELTAQRSEVVMANFYSYACVCILGNMHIGSTHLLCKPKKKKSSHICTKSPFGGGGGRVRPQTGASGHLSMSGIIISVIVIDGIVISSWLLKSLITTMILF